jgi:hypothetical protein
MVEETEYVFRCPSLRLNAFVGEKGDDESR